ncbi:MAG: iron-regulated protein [Flavobacteriales bacterium]|nr:iron-regulated protein [Flavobacteriales bacterium]|tara:strand:+ start:73 stop:927 length:855 start_codon:yes stop_codon:yes gene_type:complete
MQKLVFFIFSIVLVFSFKNDKPAYIIYNSKGKKVSFFKMKKELKNKELIFFGEIHNNPIAHWLQLELTQELGKSKDLILGAEMFESDNQKGLNLYLNDSIDSKGLDTVVRLWSNYKTDYKPLVDYAKRNKLPFIATNIPRRFASMVYKKGGFEVLDSLSADEKLWVAPLPFPFDSEIPGYKAMLNMFPGHGGPEIVKAQASKDATMAHFILQNIESNHIFLHYNGSYHSNNYEGILWYVKQQNPKIKCGTISTVIQEDVGKIDKENIGLADFIIVVDKDMTTTY